MAKGLLLVAFKWATEKQIKDIKKDFELITQKKSLSLKTKYCIQNVKNVGSWMCNMAIALRTSHLHKQKWYHCQLQNIIIILVTICLIGVINVFLFNYSISLIVWIAHVRTQRRNSVSKTIIYFISKSFMINSFYDY